MKPFLRLVTATFAACGGSEAPAGDAAPGDASEGAASSTEGAFTVQAGVPFDADPREPRLQNVRQFHNLPLVSHMVPFAQNSNL